MTRAPVKLSREMKLLLGLLLLVAAIGLWYVLTNKGGSPETQTPTATPSDTVPVTTPDKPEVSSGQASGVASSGQVDVEVIPPFPTDGSSAAPTNTPPKDTPPTPAGINPAGTLAAVPGNNPFRPLSLDDTGTTAATSTPTPTPAPVPTPTASVNPPVASAPRITPIQTGGALGLNAIPGSSGASGSSSSGPLPIPTIPGADGSTNPPVVTPMNPGGTVAVTTPAPVKPPVAGVSVPALTRVPTGAATPATQSGATAPAALPTGAPIPGTPQVISEVGSVTSGTASTATTLDTFVQVQQLAFNAVVLGPVNTAIFRSKDGYVVVAVGQTLPDSQVTVKEVTATGATLSLGNDSKTLELDKR